VKLFSKQRVGFSKGGISLPRCCSPSWRPQVLPGQWPLDLPLAGRMFLLICSGGSRSWLGMLLLICSPCASDMFLLICSLGVRYVFVNLFALFVPKPLLITYFC